MNLAQGRLDHGPPVAVIDIGSNSVRLVVYEGLTRSPTPIFNEKVLAGLGREVQSTGLLAADAIDKAIASLRRFRALCDRMEVAQLWGIATAACRDADNGKAFVAEAERICGAKIDVLSGKREAELSALGVVSGFHRPDGVVGDLGGGDEFGSISGVAAGGGRDAPQPRDAADVTQCTEALQRVQRLVHGVGREQPGRLHLAAKAGENFFIEDRCGRARQPLVDDEAHRIGTDVDDGDGRAKMQPALREVQRA